MLMVTSYELQVAMTNQMTSDFKTNEKHLKLEPAVSLTDNPTAKKRIVIRTCLNCKQARTGFTVDAE